MEATQSDSSGNERLSNSSRGPVITAQNPLVVNGLSVLGRHLRHNDLSPGEIEQGLRISYITKRIREFGNVMKLARDLLGNELEDTILIMQPQEFHNPDPEKYESEQVD